LVRSDSAELELDEAGFEEAGLDSGSEPGATAMAMAASRSSPAGLSLGNTGTPGGGMEPSRSGTTLGCGVRDDIQVRSFAWALRGGVLRAAAPGAGVLAGGGL
jgi:hypothetical protein